MPTDFDDMEEANPDVLWANFTEDGVRLESEEEVVDTIEGPLVGVLKKIDDNAGEHNSKMYQVVHPDYDSPIAFWGKESINIQVERANLSVGDEIGIQFTGDWGETDNGKFKIFEVRYAKA